MRGRLYDLPSGYPALRVPDVDVFAVGTADPSMDASLQHELNQGEARRPDGTIVYGELITFDDPEARLTALDRLEGFDPRGPTLYRRVLVPAETSGGACVLAWAYVTHGSSGARLPGGRWPP